MGVWIETEIDINEYLQKNVTPCVGVWIETALLDQSKEYQESHPAWVCGLKPIGNWRKSRNKLSHPAWVCGLKHNEYDDVLGISGVTPCVGVWIETFSTRNRRQVIGHTLRGCVD